MVFNRHALTLLMLGLFLTGTSPLFAATTFVTSKSLLEVSCVKLYSQYGVFTKAYSVNLLLTSNGGKQILRLVSPVSLIADPP